MLLGLMVRDARRAPHHEDLITPHMFRPHPEERLLRASRRMATKRLLTHTGVLAADIARVMRKEVSLIRRGRGATLERGRGEGRVLAAPIASCVN